jgi:predicted nucleotidyltransferase
MTRSIIAQIEARIPEAPREIRPCREQLAEVVAMIVREFQPERIILFGSYAYGRPILDSDVDLMVIMDTPARPVDQAAAIRERLELKPSFPLDLLVRTPERIESGLAEGNVYRGRGTQRKDTL